MKIVPIAISFIALALSGCAHTGYQRGYAGYDSGYGSGGYGGGYSVHRYYETPPQIYYEPGYSRSYQRYAPPRPHHERHHDHDDHGHDRHEHDRRGMEHAVQWPSRPWGGHGHSQPTENEAASSRHRGQGRPVEQFRGFGIGEQRQREGNRENQGRQHHKREQH